MLDKTGLEIQSKTNTLIENIHSDFADDIIKGLGATEKSIPSVYFYDEVGSQLFEEICQLPEYYLTRSETEILKKHSAEIATLASQESTLVELGSGSSIKTRYLIKAFLNQYEHVEYVPIDVSESILEESAHVLKRLYPDLSVKPVVARYEDGLAQTECLENPRLIIWLGSSIGNLPKKEAARFLRDISYSLSSSDQILIGIDLLKDKKTLERAYNDAAGVTAEFNLNLLSRINNELGGQFDLKKFRHIAILNEDKGCIEMYLQSTCSQTVPITDLDLDISFTKNELVHTENSHKYTLNEIENLAKCAGMILKKQWFDSKRWFALNLFVFNNNGKE